MPEMAEQITAMMKGLKLAGMAKGWQGLEFTDRAQFALDLLRLELREREVNRINKLTKKAGFRVLKTLDDFIRNDNIKLPEGLAWEYLTDLKFLSAKENVILAGGVGTGKTHLATALAVKACQERHEVRFYTAASLANLLMEKHNAGKLNAFLSSLRKVELIVLDEIGYVPLHHDAAELLFQIVADSYEYRSMIVTSNLEFANWNAVFGDECLTAALVDRLVHHSRILVFSGESFRLAQSMKMRKGGE